MRRGDARARIEIEIWGFSSKQDSGEVFGLNTTDQIKIE